MVDPSGTAVEPESSDAAPPEEWTPEEVRDAFRRYDLIIALGVVLAAFFAASFLSSAPDLWQRLRTGQRIAEEFPRLSRVGDFAYTAASDVVATNPSWLYDVGSYGLFQAGALEVLGARFAPLVVTKVIFVVMAVALLLTLRYRGPTLAWHSLCVLLALLALGSWLDVGPQAAAYLLLAASLVVWHRATSGGSAMTLYLLIPIAILWANLDMSFLVLPMVTTVLGIGAMLRRRSDGDVIELPGPGSGQLAIVMVGTWLAGFVSPYFWRNAVFPWTWTIWDIRYVPRDELAHSGWAGVWSWFATEGFMKFTEAGEPAVDYDAYYANLFERVGTWPMLAWMTLLGLAAVSFLLRPRPFPWSRLALLAFAFGLPWMAERWLPFSAVLLAYIASLNGQEYYLQRFGSDARTDFSWLIGSQLARMGLIVLVFLALLGTLTGRIQGHPAAFGFAIAEDEFIVEGAKRLDEMGLEGNPFPLGPAGRVASYLMWEGPTKKTFVDFRWPRAGEGAVDYTRARHSLYGRFGTPDEWRKIFAKWNVTHVILDARDDSTAMRQFRNTFALRPEFAPLHADDQCIIYGVLLESPDYERIRSQRIRPTELAFGERGPTPSATSLASSPSWFFDSLWPYRYVEKPPGLVEGTFYLNGGGYLSEPASTVVAVDRFRAAVAQAPNSPPSNLQLGRAYLKLAMLEINALDEDWRRHGARESGERESSSAAVREYPEVRPSLAIPLRHQGAMAALQSARTAGDDSAELHSAFEDLCERNLFFDLGLRHAEALRDRLPEEQARAIDERISRLRSHVAAQQSMFDDQVEANAERLRNDAAAWDAKAAEMEGNAKTASGDEKTSLSSQADAARQQSEILRTIAQNGDPLFNSRTALALGLVERSLEELERAPTGVADPFLQQYAVELYLCLGWPEKALDRLRVLESQPPPPFLYHWLLEVGATDARRPIPSRLHRLLWLRARCLYAAGRLEEAEETLNAAVARCREDRMLSTMQLMVWETRTGMLANNLGSVALKGVSRVVTDAADEADCLFDLGLVQIEMGKAKVAVANFESALASDPHYRLRPVMDLYQRAVQGKGLAPIAPRNPGEDVVRRFEERKEEKETQKP